MLKILLAVILFFSTSTFAYMQDKQIYQRKEVLYGNISSAGSDTFATLMTKWAALFKAFYPAVNVQIQTSGSASAIAALLEATAQIGTMSRRISAREINQFERKYGYPPKEIIIAIDVIALFVNQDNPLKSISLLEIDAIFSRLSRCSFTQSINHWGELGLTGSWEQKRIQLFGRNAISGTYDFFNQKLLCSGGFRSEVNALPSSAAVVQAVSSSLNAIGYAGVGYQAAGARMLPLKVGNQQVTASVENVLSNAYPLSRYLYVYVNKKPNQPLPTKEAEFIKLMLSTQGQAEVAALGFIPLSRQMVQNQLIKLGLD